MSFTNVDSLSLGNILHIVFDHEIYAQISVDYRDFEMIQRLKISDSLPREYRYFLQKSLGPAAIGYRDPGLTGRSFPTSQQVSTAEAVAKLKELVATIELEYNLWYRAMKTPEKYAEPLAVEIQAKAAALKRRLAADLYGDGLGILGTATATVTTSTSQATLTLRVNDTDQGHAGMFEIDDQVVHYSSSGGSGTTVTLASGTFTYWQIVSRDRTAQTVVLSARDANGAAQTINSWTPSAGEVFVKYSQPTVANPTSVADYGLATEVIVGLESWGQSDGRTIYGVAMSGSLNASRFSGGGNPIDVRHVQRALDQAKVNVGQDRYRYKMMLMAPETQAAMIESRESDRRFMAVADKARGIDGAFMYFHGNDKLESVTSEFCPPKRLYILPEAKDGKKVIQYIGSEFETVKAQGGADFHLKPASGGSYVGNIQSFVQGVGALICVHPRALCVINNFSNS